MPHAAPPTVAILLATYNGQPYLPEQLNSFARQTHPAWQVWASDDGSTDRTRDILDDYRSQWQPGQLTIIKGPCRGSSLNFLSMVHNVGIRADYYAYSDQDDVWEAEKLARAVQWLAQQPEECPALYCTRTRLVDQAGQELGTSPLFTRPPSFANALMQNITGGNTMVFNNAARQLLLHVPFGTPLVIHDWWTYLAVTAAGGPVRFDAFPSVRYRQHEGNLIGMSADGPGLGSRIKKLFTAQLRRNGDLNVAALQHLRPFFSADAARVFDLYVQARNTWWLPRLIKVKQAGLYRLTTTGNIGLLAAALANKF